jgi:hypothetical protein
MKPKINLAAAAIRPHQTSSAKPSPDVEPARVMPPLTARVGSSFRRFVSHVPIAYDETISLRDETRQVMCGDCGIHPNSRDICPKCGGHAEPVTNQNITNRVRAAQPTARWAMRRAEARRRKVVMRKMR